MTVDEKRQFMSKFTDAYIVYLKEESENNRKRLHNIDCKTNDIEPYDNTAYLKYINIVNKMISTI